MQNHLVGSGAVKVELAALPSTALLQTIKPRGQRRLRSDGGTAAAANARLAWRRRAGTAAAAPGVCSAAAQRLAIVL